MLMRLGALIAEDDDEHDSGNRRIVSWHQALRFFGSGAFICSTIPRAAPQEKRIEEPMQRVRRPGANLYRRRGALPSATLAFLFLFGCSSVEAPASPEASVRDRGAPREAEDGPSALPSLEMIIAQYATWQARS